MNDEHKCTECGDLIEEEFIRFDDPMIKGDYCTSLCVNAMLIKSVCTTALDANLMLEKYGATHTSKQLGKSIVRIVEALQSTETALKRMLLIADDAALIMKKIPALEGATKKMLKASEEIIFVHHRELASDPVKTFTTMHEYEESKIMNVLSSSRISDAESN